MQLIKQLKVHLHIVQSQVCLFLNQNQYSNILITEEIQRAWKHDPGIVPGLKASNQQSTLANSMWVLEKKK